MKRVFSRKTKGGGVRFGRKHGLAAVVCLTALALCLVA